MIFFLFLSLILLNTSLLCNSKKNSGKIIDSHSKSYSWSMSNVLDMKNKKKDNNTKF